MINFTINIKYKYTELMLNIILKEGTYNLGNCVGKGFGLFVKTSVILESRTSVKTSRVDI